MATYYVNAATGNAAYDGLSESDLNAAIANRGPVLTIQAAVALAAAGDCIRVASGTYTAPTGGIIITVSLTIEGEPGVIVQSFNKAVNEPVFDIQVAGGTTLEKVQLKKMKLKNAVAAGGSAFSGNYGVKCDLGNTASTKMNWLVLEDLDVVGMGDTGFYLKGGGGTNDYFIWLTLRRCIANANSGEGIYVNTCINCLVETCYAITNQLNGIRVDQSVVTILNSSAEDNCLSGSVSATLGGQFRIRSCNSATIIGCDIENFTSASHTSKRAIVGENTPGICILTCNYYNSALASTANERCVYLIYDTGGAYGAHHAYIGPSRVSNVLTYLEVNYDAGDPTKFDKNVDALLPFPMAGGTPANILPATMHMRSWT